MSRLLATRFFRSWLKSKSVNDRSSKPRNFLNLLALEDRCTPATFTINTTSDVTASDSNLTLREAITSLNLGNNSGLSAAEQALVVGTYGTADTIVFTGLTGTITIAGSAFPGVAKSVVIAGPGASKLSLSGGNAFRIFDFTVAGKTTTISGLTLSGGNITGTNGGAIRANGTDLTLTDVVLSNNTSNQDGGALYIGHDGSGGIIAKLATLRTTFANNRAGSTIGQGGAIWTNIQAAFDETTFSGNKVISTGSFKGGGAINTGSSIVARNTTFADNSATGNGGAIHLESASGPFILRNCTVAFNTASGAGGGGGIYRSNPGSMQIISTIVSNNISTATANEDLFAPSGVNVIAADSAIGTSTGVTTFTPSGTTAGLIGNDFKLRALADNGGPTQTIAFASNSPLRGKGSNVDSLTTDQRGRARNDGGGVDIGAFELNSIVTNTNDSGVGSLREAVAENNRIGGNLMITFDSSFSTAKTITLTSGELAFGTGGVHIEGTGAGNLTISGNNNSRIFNTSGGAPADVFLFNGMTLTKGKATGIGGAIVGNDEQIQIFNSNINTSSATGNGGGIAMNSSAGQLALNSTVITGNTSAFVGGGVSVYGSVTMNFVTISGNTASDGAGLLTSSVATVTISNSTLSGNSAANRGGGWASFNSGGKLTVINSVISNNTAANGAGIYAESAATDISITGSSITGNTASSQGGGIRLNYIGGVNMTVTNTTISGNKAADGGGIRTNGAFGTINLHSSTITNNTASVNGGGLNGHSDTPGQIVNVESTIISGNSDTSGGTSPDFENNANIIVNRKNSAIGSSSGLISVDQGGNLAFGTNLKLAALSQIGSQFVHLPDAESPVRDVGSNPGAQSLDQRGNSRTWGGQSDIGSVELNPDFVVRNANDAGVGSLRQQVLDANAFAGTNTITFDNTVFNVAKTITLTSGELGLTEAATISGPGQNLLTISGNNASRIFNILGAPSASSFAFNDFKITQGKSTGSGGAIVGGEQNLQLTNLTISNSSAVGLGGAVSTTNTGDFIVTNCTITGNSSGGGGGLFTYGKLTITASTISANTASSGGGLFTLTSPNVNITASVLSGNTAASNGAGWYAVFDPLAVSNFILQNSLISANTGGNSGGGLYFSGNIGTNSRILNCTIIGNICGGGAGGGGVTLLNVTGTLNLWSSTITGNSANSGGGLYAVLGSKANLNIESAIVSGNTAVFAADIFNSNGIVAAKNSAYADAVSVTDVSGNLIGKNLLLGALGNYGGSVPTIPLLPGSPAINAGSNPAGLTLDARGKTRTASSAADIGAFESQGFTLAVTSGSGQSAPISTAFASPLVATVSANNAGDPVTGGTVTFTAPGSGASATPSPQTITIDAAGKATSGTLTANATMGNYNISASTIEATPVNFALTNTETLSLVVNLVTDTVANDGFTSLREAIAYANSKPGADTITFDSAVFNVAKTITLTGGELASVAGQSMTISGPGANLLTISGNNVSRVFGFKASASTDTYNVSGLTITGGLAGGGSGLDLDNETVNITDVTFKTNHATGTGGAVRMNGTGILTVTGCTFTNNTSQTNGGGIHATGGSLTIRNSTFTNNGVISSTGSGGGISAAGTVVVQNSTIVSNTAGTAGGGGIRSTGTLSIESSIASGNTSSAGPDINSTNPVTLTNSAVGSLTGWTFGTGSNNLAAGTALKLGALANNGGPTLTFMPAIDSPLRNKGSNPGLLATDQRGLPRGDGVGNFDIGAVQVHTTNVNSIVRIDANPTSAASVGWTVTLAAAVTGVGAANFTLTGSGTITGVTGSGTTYTVTANTGADGDLTLHFANSLGLNLLPANLPFAGQSYFVNKVALGAAITTSKAVLTDVLTGAPTVTFTAAYTEVMDTATAPTFSFPVENPGAAMTLQSGKWTDSKTYAGTFYFADTNTTLANIDVAIAGGKDTFGTVAGTFTTADLFGIDTSNPYADTFTRDNALNNKLASVSWTVTFTEPVTGVTPSSFALFNGGLSGAPTITGVTGSGTTYTVAANTGGSGAGTLALIALGGGTVVDLNGNVQSPLAQMGGSYNIDFISPAASKLTLNTVLVSDANVGPNGFAAVLKYNELMDQAVNPTVSFPAEFPNSLTFNSGVWLDAYTYQAKFDVADLGVAQNDIDIRFTGAQDLAGNPQTTFNAIDVLNIDTQNPVIASITSPTANGTYGIGQTIDIELNFSEQVNLDGTLNVTLDTGAVVSIVGPLSGTTLTGTYTVMAGQNSPDLNVTNIALTGGSTLRDDATNTSVLTLPVSNLANNSAIVVNTGAAAPVVNSFVVNDGAVQRSRLTKVVVNFAAPVDAALFQTLGAVTLTRTGIPTNNQGAIGTVVNTSNSLQIASASGTVSSITLTFANISNAGVEFGSLSDGRWQLAVNPAGFLSANGPTDTQLRRLFGNVNNDTTVDAGDFAFLPAFGAAVANPFDFNNNGDIDSATDFSSFGNRFGFTLV